MKQLYSSGELVGVDLAGQQGGHAASGRAPRSRVYPFNQGTSTTGSLDSHSQSLQASSLSSAPEAGGETGQSSAGGGAESIAMHDLKLLLTSLQHSGSAGDREAVLRQLQQMLGNAPVRPAPRALNPGFRW